ncbi:MAG TPA: hypothetical protein VHZ51_06075 [Ktedonobacteraceae bacterium]|jgi:Ca2+-dependent lipid-binding protein|nr:hypothetical protein [Ktedonobacteraceae bacterium]
MPKKTVVRGGAQQKSRNQRYVKHVYKAPEKQTSEASQSTVEEQPTSIAETATTPAGTRPEEQSASSVETATVSASAETKSGKQSASRAATIAAPAEVKAEEAPKASSASARMAARRQGSQRMQQRHAASLITAEHFSYVKRDLKFIAALAIIMIVAIIVLYIVLGARGVIA